MKTPNGIILYAGPSMVDGAPIVAILTGLSSGSANRKTGNLLQTWILRSDIDPVAAVKSGEDATVCGDCIHRGFAPDGSAWTRTCYVNVGQAPLAVYRAYHRGVYPAMGTPEATQGIARATGRGLRVGSYGDPAAVPLHVWEALFASLQPAFHTGYTHQWRTCNPAYAQYCMASADTPSQVAEAESLGYRAFVVVPCGTDKPKGTTQCPSDPSLAVHVPCSTCRRCDGTASNRRHSVSITAHGPAARRFLAKLAVIN